MFAILRRAPRELFIDRDRVFCPVRRADTDIETCLSCRWANAIDLDAKTPVVRCSPLLAGPVAPFCA